MSDDTNEKTKVSFFLFSLLGSLLFIISLGVGPAYEDIRFWYVQTWTGIYLEWLFVLSYFAVTRRLSPLIQELWSQHKAVIQLLLLWSLVVTASYLLSPFYTPANPIARMRLAETLTHVLFFGTLWDYFRRYRIDLRQAWLTILLATGAILLTFLIALALDPTYRPAYHLPHLTFAGYEINGNIRRLGYLMEVSLLILLILYPKKIISLLFAFVIFVFMLWLGGRASILGLFAGLGFYAFYTRRHPSWKQLLFVTLSGIILLLAVWKLHLIDLGHFSEMIQRTLQAGSLEKLSNTRFDIWSGILEHLKGHWLLGNGPQSYYFYLGRDPMTIHAHNFLMQFLGEWGILGSVLFLYLLFKAFAYGWKLHGNGATRSPEHALSGSIIVALTVSGLFGGTYFFIQTSIYLALSYALWITPRRQR